MKLIINILIWVTFVASKTALQQGKGKILWSGGRKATRNMRAVRKIRLFKQAVQGRVRAVPRPLSSPVSSSRPTSFTNSTWKLNFSVWRMNYSLPRTMKMIHNNLICAKCKNHTRFCLKTTQFAKNDCPFTRIITDCP